MGCQHPSTPLQLILINDDNHQACLKWALFRWIQQSPEDDNTTTTTASTTTTTTTTPIRTMATSASTTAEASPVLPVLKPSPPREEVDSIDPPRKKRKKKARRRGWSRRRRSGRRDRGILSHLEAMAVSGSDAAEGNAGGEVAISTASSPMSGGTRAVQEAVLILLVLTEDSQAVMWGQPQEIVAHDPGAEGGEVMNRMIDEGGGTSVFSAVSASGNSKLNFEVRWWLGAVRQRRG